MQPACCLLQSHHSLPGRKIYKLNLTSIHLLPKPTLILYCKWALIGRTSQSWSACVSILVWDVCWRIRIFDNEWLFCKVRGFLFPPKSEVSSSVWSPYQKKDIESLEKVQRRASRLALKQKRGEMSYEDRCHLLNWQTLEKRREFLSLIQCYKIVLEIDSLHFSDFFELTKCNRTRANHDYKLYVKIAIVNCYKFSFFVRIVNMWNNLPKDIVHAGSLTLFRNRLKIYMNIDWDDGKQFLIICI